MELTEERTKCQPEAGARGEESGTVPSGLFLQQRGGAHQSREASCVGNIKASAGNGRQSCYVAAKGDHKDPRCCNQVGSVDNWA